MQSELDYDILNFMLPRDYIEEINSILGPDLSKFLDSYEDSHVRSLRVNTLKGSTDEFEAVNPWTLSKKERVLWCPTGYYVDSKDEGNPVGRHPYHEAGAYYIQEASAMAPVEELDVTPGDRVLDLCAAPGGKSTQIASHLKNHGLLVSNEPNLPRAKILSENIERMGIGNALVVSHDPSYLEDKFEGYFNKILVDAPCSGEGMFRKNPEAIDEWSMDNVKLCSIRQKDILDSAIKMLSPGGRMVYSTCTFSLAEDEDNVEYILSKYPDMILLKQHKIWPHEVKGEGHFMAVFTKGAESKSDEGALLNDALPPCGFEKGVNIKTIGECIDFLDGTLNVSLETCYPDGLIYTRFGDEVYALPMGFPNMKGLKVLRSGLHLGTLKKNRFEPSHSLAMFLKPSMVSKYVALNKEEAIKYLHGECVNSDTGSGWSLIHIDGYSLGWGKVSGTVVKNHYPKGLRIQW